MFLGLKHNKFRVRNLLSPAGLKKNNLQKLKLKQKNKLACDGFLTIKINTHFS
jgi:hypothetical protein